MGPIQKNPETRVSLFIKRKCFPLLLGKFMTRVSGAHLVSADIKALSDIAKGFSDSHHYIMT